MNLQIMRLKMNEESKTRHGSPSNNFNILFHNSVENYLNKINKLYTILSISKIRKISSHRICLDFLLFLLVIVV